MTEYSVLWTILPNGADEHGNPRFSVHVAPRLTTAGRLADHPDWTDWPAGLTGLRVTVSFPDVPARGVATLLSRPDSAAWRAVLPATTRVDAHRFTGLGSRRIRSYPVDQVLAYTRDRYGRFGAEHPEEFPTRDMVADDDAFGDISDVGELGDAGGGGRIGSAARTDHELRADLERRYDIGPGSGPDRWAIRYQDLDPERRNAADDRAAFFDAERFHRRLPYDVFPPGQEPPAPASAQLDFHTATALAADHPRLQRMLGLVLDLRLDPAGNEELFQKVFTAPVRDTTVTLELDWPGGGHDGLRARSIRPGVLCRVGRETGGATVFRARERDGGDLQAGMLRIGAAGDSGPSFAVAVADSDGAALRLRQFAGNATRFHGGPGRGSSARAGAVQGPEGFPLPALSSGGMSVSRTGRASGLAAALASGTARNARMFTPEGRARQGAAEPLRADDLVRGYRWDVFDTGIGTWRSLMERQGRYEFTRAPDLNVTVIDEGTTTSAATSSARPGDQDLYVHESMMRWDGWSLAVPRPGKAVQDDGSVSAAPPAPDPAFGFAGRYQVRPGSLPALRFGRTYRFRARAVDLAGNSLTVAEADLRIEPVLVTEPQTYGRFEPVPPPEVVHRPGDPALGHGESVAVAVIRSATGQEPTGARSARQVNPPRTSVRMAERHGLLPALGGTLRQYLELSGRDRAQGDHGPLLGVGYLPEALARQIEVRGVPGDPIPPISLVTRRWPEAKPFRVELRSGPARTEYDPLFRELRVFLEPGDVYRLRFSARLTDADLDQSALWPWIERWARAKAIDPAALRAGALRGHHWMLTPYRELLLVHAVRRPLLAPRFEPGFGPLREPGATSALLAGKVAFCPRSTGTLDLTGEWEMPVDLGPGTADPVTPRPFRATTHTYHHRRDPGPLPNEEILELSGFGHEFADTRHRMVSYRMVATSRFLEHFPDDDGPTTRVSQPQPVNVPASVRPAAPQVEYIVPIFKWETDARGRSVRRAGLRVYLRRPWWSSGPGELLGVVLHGGSAPPPAAAQRYFSRWGADPTIPDPLFALPSALGTGSFPLATATATSGLTLAETGEGPVHVAGHRLGFDPERDLWFCDLRLITARGRDGAEEPIREYFPFVRLALARYQPHALPDCHLSPVVTADFVQIAPDRHAQVLGDGDIRTVVVEGVAPQWPLTGGESSQVQVTVEVRRPRYRGPADDPLGWVPYGVPALLTPRFTGGSVRWRGEVNLGNAPAGRSRLVIEEFERRRRNASAGEQGIGRRLVHTDILPLD